MWDRSPDADRRGPSFAGELDNRRVRPGMAWTQSADPAAADALAGQTRITGIALCCARAASGHATAAPERMARAVRRCIQDTLADQFGRPRGYHTACAPLAIPENLGWL
jgi:hypothetical protein